MSPNPYVQDFLIKERLQERICEAEQNRRAAQATGSHNNGLRHLIGQPGTLLVMFGT